MLNDVPRCDPTEVLQGRCNLCGLAATATRSEAVPRTDPWGVTVPAVRCAGERQGKPCPGVVYLYPPPPKAKADYPEKVEQ